MKQSLNVDNKAGHDFSIFNSASALNLIDAGCEQTQPVKRLRFKHLLNEELKKKPANPDFESLSNSENDLLVGKCLSLDKDRNQSILANSMVTHDEFETFDNISLNEILKKKKD